MSRRHLVMLLVLSAIWGASFLFIKIGVRELQPATLIWVRVGLATLTLIPVAVITLGARATFSGLAGAWKPLLVMGLLNSAAPFWLISWAEQDVDSGLTAILQASAPLFTALLALWLDRTQRVTGIRLVGLLLGFAGVAALVGMPGGGSNPIRALAVVLSAAFYASGALFGGRALGHVPPLLVATGTMIAATVLTMPFGIAQAPGHFPGWGVVGSMLALGIGGSAVAYVLYFGLIAGAGASRAILVTYLVPPLAIGYGALFLGETVRPVAIGGLALVLGGVALGTGSVRLSRRRQAVAAGSGP